ncbi:MULTISPECIES: hypothetical protein [unclassified Bradyrhizobium]|uniref:hypothetical protein n=1 Tax=unclassified Bradyrhizobium TaxID=2631580 RepID=UPI002FF115E4
MMASAMVSGLRRAVAFPVYLLAFACHLLCMFFTWLAQYISGDDFVHRSPWPPLGFLVAVATALLVAFVARGMSVRDDSQFELVAPVGELQKAPNYTEQELARVMPHIEMTACIFAQLALRHSLRPRNVAFLPCSNDAKFKVKFREDLGVATVAGQLEIDGASRGFTAVLNHHPAATEIDGYRAVRLDVDGIGTFTSAAASRPACNRGGQAVVSEPGFIAGRFRLA